MTLFAGLPSDSQICILHIPVLHVPVYSNKQFKLPKNAHFLVLETILVDMYWTKNKYFNPPISVIHSSSQSNIWTFLKSIIELTTSTALIGLDTREVREKICRSLNEVHMSKSQCIEWLNNNFQNSQIITNLITKEIFTNIINSLDCAYDGRVLKVKKSYQVSPHLFCIFYFLSFSSMNVLIETLQSILQRSTFTFQLLSKKYLRNMTERARIAKPRCSL